VETFDNYEVVKRKAESVHQDVNEDFHQVDHILAYQDGTKATLLPNSTTPFSVLGYRQFINKSFSRMRLYLLEELYGTFLILIILLFTLYYILYYFCIIAVECYLFLVSGAGHA